MQRCIDASGIPYEEDERQELLAEGLAILYQLAAAYRPLPARPGIDDNAGCDRLTGARGGRFSGYAAMFLPRRLGDAWHRWHPEHRYITDPVTGRRRWHYDPAAISLDGLFIGPDGEDGHSSGDRALAHARTLRDFVPVTTAAA